MGQRHQLYVIAKIGHRYRPLAAVYNQWLYGEGTLRRCRHLLQVFPAQANRVPIAQELRAAREKGDDFWASKDIKQPFPFIATCLTVGSSFDPEDGYQRRVHPMAFNTLPKDVHNDDGITVIDISNLDCLRYCFTFPKTQRDGFGYTDLKEPLRASKYLSRYVKSREMKKLDPDTRLRYDELVKQLESHELVDAFALQETWSTLAPSDEDATSPLRSEEVNEEQLGQLSLRDSAIDQTIASIVKDGDLDPSTIAEAQKLSDFTPRLRNKLKSLAEAGELPSSPAMARILEAAFADEVTVDLSPFRTLAAEQIVEAATKLLQTKAIQSLDLSHLHQLSNSDLSKILSVKSHLETLYLLETPQITLPTLTTILNNPSPPLKTIHHTTLLRNPLANPLKYSALPTALLSPPFAPSHRSPLKHILWARVVQIGATPNLRKSDGLTIDWSRAQPADNPNDTEDKIHAAVFPLHDTLLPPSKLVSGLANFFTCASRGKMACDWQSIASTGLTLAKAFSTAASTVAQEEEKKGEGATQMGALPEILFSAASMAAKISSVDWPVPYLELREGEWAAVVVNEHDPFEGMVRRGDGGEGYVYREDREKFRLAFVTPDGEGYRVESLEGFLGEVLGGSKGIGEGQRVEMEKSRAFWERKVGFVGMCEEDEVGEVVPAIRRCVEARRASECFGMMESGWEHD